MTFHAWQPGDLARMGVGAALIALTLGTLTPTGTQAQVAAAPSPAIPADPATLVEAEASAKVALLHDLALIESDVRLALLLASRQMVAMGQTHAVHAHTVVWPAVKDDLLAAGVDDLEPLLRQLAEAKEMGSIRLLGRDFMAALTRARGKIGATETEIAESILGLTSVAASRIDASGTTPAEAYREAWSMLSVARATADLLAYSKDPAKAKAATKIILALDDALIFLPDPAVSSPVDIDPATLQMAVDAMKDIIASGV